MKALAKLEPQRGIWRIDAPEPTPGPNDLAIRITHTSICGTDVHIHEWDAWAARTVPVPMIVGHEYVGIVEEVGEEVEGYAVGDRVSGEGHITCGHCRNCRAGRRHLCRDANGVGVDRPGAFAERFVLPAFNAFRVPDGIPDDWAAILDPFGNAVHTALAYDLVGEDVLITGAGPIGIMASAIARFVGARYVVVTDVHPYRLELARAMGAADRVIDAAASDADLHDVMADLGMTEGFDVVMEMSGAADAYRQVLATVNHGGRVALLGIPSRRVPIDLNAMIFKGIEVRGIYGRQMFETWYKMANLLQAGLDLEPVITHRLSADAFQDGFDAMIERRAGKVILDWR